MGEDSQSIYQVCTQPDYVFVKVNGRASYINCDPFRRFLRDVLADGQCKFVFDFADCSGLDSTFLGILAGVALAIRGKEEDSCMTLLQLGERNLETVKNLGIHRIANVRAKENPPDIENLEGIGDGFNGETASVREVYEAHKRLTELNESNARKFHDVVAFLEQRLDEEEVGDRDPDKTQ